MLELKTIATAGTEWAALVVSEPKPDGLPRFDVDYRTLNALKERDSYPIPRADDCMDSFGDALMFSRLEASCQYSREPIEDPDSTKNAFTFPHQLYLFSSKPFGLQATPRTFQQTMDVILLPVQWQFTSMYFKRARYLFPDLRTNVPTVFAPYCCCCCRKEPASC